MAYTHDVPSNVIPARTEGGPEYASLNYDPADELSGMAPWDPNYVPPDPPAADGTRFYPGLGPQGWVANRDQRDQQWANTPVIGDPLATPNLPR